MTKKASLRYVFALLLAFLLNLPQQADAQELPQAVLQVGQIGRGRFDDSTVQDWYFTGAEGDIVEIALWRTGGQFAPEVTVFTPNNNLLEASINQGQSLIFDGLPMNGDYTIRVSANNIIVDSVLIPNEYSLSLNKLGRHRSDSSEGLSALPEIISVEIAPLFEGNSTQGEVLAIELFGEVDISQPDVIQERNRFVIDGTRSIDLNNMIPISRGIDAIAFHDTGVALRSATQGGFFFTDQNIISLEQEGSISHISLENGQTISTDFYRIQSLLAVDGLVRLSMQDDLDILLEGQSFEFLRRGGINGEGPNAEPVNILRIDDAEIQSDMTNWQSLAFVDAQLRVILNDDLRLLGDEANMRLFQRGNNLRPELDELGTDIHIYDIEFSDAENSFTIALDPMGIAEIEIAENQVTVLSLDGSMLSDSLVNLNEVSISGGIVRFLRDDGSINRLLLDETVIETQDTIEIDEAALANQANYSPRNFNNLGMKFFDYHPIIDLSFTYLPVNRVTGNFVYTVQDFSVPSHTLALDWTRFYNSQSPAISTPAYMLEADYLFGQMGSQWRHSYQYELDITYTPLGQVRMILPDGSSHIFAAINNTNIYRSESLLSWTIERGDRWQAFTTEGMIYQFDAIGRLQGIATVDGVSLLFSPIPQIVLETEDWASGFYVTEIYGRRLETFADESGYIREVRDPQQRSIFYEYADDELTHVQYVAYDQSANYTYDNGFLNSIEDPHSPYHQKIELTYDVDGRVLSYELNPDGDVSFRTTYDYETGVTREIQFVDEKERETIWQYDSDFRLTEWQLPREEWVYRLTYSPATGRLAEFGQPDRSVLRFNFDEYGYLISFTDPQFGSADGAYRLTYESINDYQRVLTELDSLSGDYVALTYDDFGRVASVTRPFDIVDGDSGENTTTYSYDLQGRLDVVSQVKGSMQYGYDDFGYVRSVNSETETIFETRYDFVGRLLQVSDVRAGGKINYLIWDDDRNQIVRVSVGASHYEYEYDIFGNLITYNVDGREESYSYNGLNQMVLHIDSLGAESSYRYDEVGNLLTLTEPSDLSTDYSYDALNFLMSRSRSDGSNMAYNTAIDFDSNRTIYAATNSANEMTEYRYDSLGRVRRVILADRNDSLMANYSFSYSALGFLEEVAELHVPGGRVLMIEYDVQGNPLSTNINNIAETSYRYDSIGNMTSVIDPEGRIIQYEYDGLGNIIRVILADGSEQFYLYDEQGRLIRYTDALGGEWHYRYDDFGQVVEIGDSFGKSVSYEYDERGNIVSLVDANGNQSFYIYNDPNQVIEFIDAEGNSVRYDYDESGRLLQITQTGGLVTDMTYDDSGYLVAITQPSDREFLYGHDSLGRITSVTNPLGHTTLYSYNTLGEIGRITDPLGNESAFQWSLSRRVLAYSGTNGAEYSYNSDEIGRLTAINNRGLLEQAAVNTRIEYDASGYVIAVRRGNSLNINSSQAIVSRYEYDENGQLISYRSPESEAAWHFSYDALGRLEMAIDSHGVATHYDYDELGNLTVFRAFGTDAQTSESYIYDGNRNLIGYVAANNSRNFFTYDANNRLIERKIISTEGDERIEQYDYDELGRVSLIRDANEQEMLLRYDVFGNLVLLGRTLSTEDGDVSLTYRYTYDEVDNLRSLELPNGQTISMTYNVLNQRVRYIDGENNSWSYSYDSGGNISQISNPLGSLLSFDYDSVNRVTQIAYPTGALVNIDYDAFGNLSEIILPETSVRNGTERETIDYTFDREGRLVSIAHADRERILFERDEQGNVSRMQNADGTEILFIYDSFGRLIAIQSPEGEMNRSYDAVGHLLTIGQGEESTSFAYNGFGDLERMESSDVIINYVYDESGNLLRRDAGDYGQITYEYDNLKRPIKISLNDENVMITYNENGWRTGLIRDNGFETRYIYDNNGRVRNIIHLGADGQRLDGFAYEYDAAGNMSRITRTDNWAVLYSYDSGQQLISERWLNPENQLAYSVTYSYDDAGNRIEQTTRSNQEDEKRTEFVYNDFNQLVSEFRNTEFPIEERLAIPVIVGLVFSLPLLWFVRRRRQFIPVMLIIPFAIPLFQQQLIPTISYEYDVNGNLTRKIYDTGEEVALSYDAFNRLVSVQSDSETENAINIRVVYDEMGRLAELYRGETEAFEFIYDAYGLLAIRNLSDDSEQIYFSPFAGETMLIETDDTLHWPTIDALGTARRMVTIEGRLNDADSRGFNSNAFGETITPYGTGSEIDAPQVLFLGQIYEPQSQLYWMGVRTYDPRLGRFLQRDPVRHDPQGNLYTYVYNRPTSLRDSNGLTPEAAFEGIAPDVPQIDPVEAIPSPTFPEIVPVPSVHMQQARENHRILRLAHETRFGLNDMTFILDNSACDLYISAVNPVSAQFQRQLGIPSSAILGLYTQENGWLPVNSPSLGAVDEPILNLENMLPTLAFAANDFQALSGCSEVFILPQIPQPLLALSDDVARESFLELLAEVPLFPVVVEQLPSLQGIEQILAEQLLPDIRFEVPEPMIVAPLSGQIGSLQEDSRTFFSDILLPQATGLSEK